MPISLANSSLFLSFNTGSSAYAMAIPSNFSEYKIDNVGEKSILIIYLLIVLLSSLIGDSIILIASARYNAIKLNKFIVVVMQHIAVADILQSVSSVLPTFVALISDFRIQGEIPGYIIYFLIACSYGSSNILITLLTTSKLAILKLPLRTRGWAEQGAHVICTSIWLSLIVFCGIFLGLCEHVLFFSYIEYNVAVFLQTSIGREVFTCYLVISSIVPTFIVALSTSAILLHLLKARKVSERTGGRVRWQGIAAVSATATVFCVSAIPAAISFFAATGDSISSSKKLLALVSKVTFVRTTAFMSALNLMCNIYIYWFAVQSFREFIKSKVTDLSESIKKYLACAGNESNETQVGEIELRSIGGETQSINF